MRFKLTGVLLACWMAGPTAQAIQIPSPVPSGQELSEPYSLTGLIETYESFGSGVVAAHPRVVLSCAHVVFSLDYLAWMASSEFYPAWNEGAPPDFGTGEVLSGYYYWRTYASAAAATDRLFQTYRDTLAAEAREFNLDFVAFFHHSKDLAGGRFASVAADGVPWLSNPSTPKTITGYPSGRYREGDPLEFRLHATSFNGALTPETRAAKRYLTLYDRAETGSGNSGGPVWVGNANGTPTVAGVLVSGQEQPEWDRSMVGVHAVSRDGWRLINSALNASGSTGPTVRAFSVAGGDIPDNWTLKSTVRVSGLPKTMVAATLDLEINHPVRAEITVAVRTPGKRTFVVYDGEFDPEEGNTITLNAENLAYLYGVNPNGNWTIFVDDWEAANEGRLVSGRLNISAR